MNEDLPYDLFVKRQLAADVIENTSPEDYAALGLIGLSPTYWKELQLAPGVIEVIVADEWDERIDAVSRTFLGLTVACALLRSAYSIRLRCATITVWPGFLPAPS